MITISVAAGGVLVATCFPVGLVAFDTTNGAGIIVAVVLGRAVCGFVGFRLIRRFWPQKD